MTRRRMLSAGSLALTAGLAAALVVAGSGAGVVAAVAAEPAASGATLPGQCVTSPQYVADGISLGCTVTGAPDPDNPNAPEQGNYVHTATIDLTAAGVVPQVVQSNDRIFQPVGTPAGTDPQITNETVTSMANRSGSVVGVNGGYFDNDKGPLLADGTPQPFSGVVCGGVVIDGQVWKSPPNDADLNASIYVNADGTMGIGQVYFDASIQVLDADGGAQAEHGLDSINTLGDGVPQPGCPKDHASPTLGTGITLITPDLGDVVLNASYNSNPESQYIVPASAAAVEVAAHADGAGGYLVDSVTTPGEITAIGALSAGQVILLASQSDVDATAGSWLKNSIQAGDTLALPQALAVGQGTDALQLGAQITSLIGGVGQIADGGVIAPAGGGTPFPQGTNAETVVGLDETGTAVTLAVIDKVSGTNTTGDVFDFPGVTWQQAAQTAIDLGASDAILLDGGGSSTLVAQLAEPAIGASGPSRVTMANSQDGANDYPIGDFNQRLVANGLFFLGTVAGPTPTPVPTTAPATPVPAAGPSLAATGSAPGGGVALAGVLLVAGIASCAFVLRRRRVR